MALQGSSLDAPTDVVGVLAAGLRDRPDGTAISSRRGSLTWRELDRRASALAAGYLELGLRPGDRLASLMPNRIDLAIHYLAAFRAGLVVAPLNYRYTAREIDHALEVSGAVALVAHAERRADLEASRLVPGLARGTVVAEIAEVGEAASGWTTVDGAAPVRRLEELIAGPVPASPFPDRDPDEAAAIFFTSGSTGPAKGVTHSLRSLGWALASAVAAFRLDDDDVFLPASSMSHIGAFLWTFSVLSVGGRAVVAETSDAGEVFALLQAERPTVLAMIPAALTALVRDHDATKEDFETLRVVRAGADKVSIELMKEFEHLVGFPIVEGYGMTEIGLASLNPVLGDPRIGSVGRPIPGFEFALRDDDGAEVPVGEVGRVWMRSASHTVGYWDNPAATAEVLVDGWLDSGDLMRSDDDGFLWFFGRKKQIIVHDGSNISPYEVEDALAEHPAVALVGVVGVVDEVHGENVRAYVTLVPGASRPTSQELIEHARERVGYKAPEEIVVLDEMPLNPTGKLDRVALKRMAEDHLHPHLTADTPEG